MMTIESIEPLVRAQTAQLALRLTPSGAAAQLGIGRDAVGRLAAGLPTHRSTLIAAAYALGLLMPPQAMAISTLPNAA